MSFNKLESRNRLFLICPTDHIESVLNQTYGGKTYFYTALGANFSWDISTQKNLTKLIENQQIEQVIFVTKHTNLFYKEALDPNSEPFYEVNETLLKLDKTLPHDFLKQSHPILRIMLLASRHLRRQRNHILRTSILGKTLKQNKTNLQSLVYYPESQVFYTPEEIEQKVLLYGDLSPN